MSEQSKTHSVEAEETVLGAILLDNSAIMRVNGTIEPEDFFSAFTMQIFSAMLALHNSKRPVDLVSVSAELERMGTLQQIGGRLYLHSLLERAVTTVDIDHHAKTILTHSVSRRMLRTLHEAIADLKEGEEPLERKTELVSELIKIGSPKNDKAVKSHVLAERGARQLVHIRERGTLGVPTGFPRLDWLTHGLIGKEVYCITADKAGGGKSALASQICRNVSNNHGPALMFAAELSDLTVYFREISSRSGHSIPEIIGDTENRFVTEYTTELCGANIHFDVTPMPSLKHILAESVRVHYETKGDLRLIVIDMLQHVDAPGKDEFERIGNAVKAFKHLAGMLQVPVVIVSSVNRTERINGLPSVRNLYGSSWIDSICAGIFCLVGADAYYEACKGRYNSTVTDRQGNEKTVPLNADGFWIAEGWAPVHPGSLVLMTLKNRHGAMKDTPLRFEGHKFTFEEYDTWNDYQARLNTRDAR